MNPFAGMSPRQLGLLSRLIEKANPPPILYRYRRASEWSIKELTIPEVHIAGVEDMNDPFEYRAPLAIDLHKLRDSMVAYAQEHLGMDRVEAQKEAASVDQNYLMLTQERIEALRSASGLVCCSSNSLSNRMWAYYADAHKGICVGYNTEFSPFCFGLEVTYRDPDGPIDLLDTLKRDPTLLSDLVSCRKGAEWDFEQEFRIPVGPFSKDHTRLLPIQPEAIAEIRLGAKIRPDFKEKIVSIGRGLPHKPRIIQMGCDDQSFSLTETIL